MTWYVAAKYRVEMSSEISFDLLLPPRYPPRESYLRHADHLWPSQLWMHYAMVVTSGLSNPGQASELGPVTGFESFNDPWQAVDNL